jgi:YHS domain-containing protein
MNDPDELDRKIDEKLAAHRESRTAAGRRTVEAMHELDRRINLFSRLAGRLIGEVIWPRVVKLAGRFENAELPPESERDGHRCVCTFHCTDQYPATATLELGVGHGGGIDNLIVSYALTILPTFIRFDGQDQLVIPLEQAEDGPVADWVEAKLLSFLDTYLQLEKDDHYQKENMVMDPVCGMSINRLHAAAHVEHRGRTYYFCVPDCQSRFTADPEKYVGQRPGG